MRKTIRSAFWEKTGAKLLSIISTVLMALPLYSPAEFSYWLQTAVPGVSLPTWAFSLLGLAIVAGQVAVGARKPQGRNFSTGARKNVSLKESSKLEADK